MVKVICYGLGAMGCLAARYMLEKGVTIVGAIDSNPILGGKDVAEVIGWPQPLGVAVSRDAAEALTQAEADIAMLCLVSEAKSMYPYIRACVEKGLNVISSSRECSYPWSVAPEETRQLDALAKQHGVTVSASGYQDVYMVNQVSQLAGTCHRVESVSVASKYDVNDYGRVVAGDMHVGESLEDFWQAQTTAAQKPSFVRFCIEAIANDMRLHITDICQSTEPLTDKADVFCKPLQITVPAGRVTGLLEKVDAATAEGVSFHGEWIGKVYTPDEGDSCDIAIKGEPDVFCHNDKVRPNLLTGTQLVNRIPDVINARPGYVTYDQLPKLVYRHLSLDSYITDK